MAFPAAVVCGLTAAGLAWAQDTGNGADNTPAAGEEITPGTSENPALQAPAAPAGGQQGAAGDASEVTPESPDNAAVAIINGAPVTLGDFKTYLVRMMGDSYLEIFINEALIEQEAKKHQIVPTPDKVAAWIDQRVEEVKLMPEYAGMSETELAELRRQYVPHARMGYMVETLVRQGQVSEDVLRRRFERLHGERRRGRHILYAVKPGPEADAAASAALDAEAKRKAERAVEMLSKGAEFADLARRESEDPSSAVRGGQLPEFGRFDMVKPFADAAFALAKDETTAVPVRSQFGWHVIQVTEITPGGGTFESMRETLLEEAKTRQLDRQEVGDFIQSLRESANVEIRLGGKR
ncbi:MAG: peptidylprolyl isomerase [Planctomycetota bacterium]